MKYKIKVAAIYFLMIWVVLILGPALRDIFTTNPSIGDGDLTQYVVEKATTLGLMFVIGFYAVRYLFKKLKS
ncbi:MAG: hypothetical protein A3B11_00905 [Candidatus Taylorbacteria bacterium RIFCSPLOWO2_01_FULL_44_26]|uniref:Uncharacterized protein n=2 Tax=Parcubacteria group TaxID=1794811 RepID=A0A1G2N5U3_9BACT|nr:MAG: hypothetical protein A2647_01250 [Candidatus Nomurabacteria bacterium RIFCSPHIGHO2_01_FULL_40_24b]OHA31504.1 MAG: hypothetical protein A3B11_00905 [Candidatus Taylorbacteria bacterium RIFCSPLOWO2_01_FULL_44_26]